MVARLPAGRSSAARGPDPRWLDPTVEGYQGACAKRQGVCRCPRCEPRHAVGYVTLGCGCVLDGPAGSLMFIDPSCLQRASQGRSKSLASAGTRTDQAVLEQRVAALHELEAGRSVPSRGFSRSGFSR